MQELLQIYVVLVLKPEYKLAVVKNTLLEKAMEASDREFGELPTVLKRKYICDVF
jgi:ribosomal protein L10